ncbi:MULTISPECIES: hypothetical protein [Pseudofrankia]|uniref:hypothetical protein n=1 Tax=Pseudofrankia TaxID=2994363 RepID=UPI000234D120|nr:MULTISPECIES: hypothetical protein [Pseudofrankia]OHV37440.1 hypothetical protein BCD49_15950 [Pseudofrankia sp. EUN1h]
MPQVEREPADDTMVTRLGGSEITVRPEPPAGRDNGAIILLRLVSPMFDTLAVAYLGPTEARALAQALLAAADTIDPTGPGGWRTPPRRR